MVSGGPMEVSSSSQMMSLLPWTMYPDYGVGVGVGSSCTFFVTFQLCVFLRSVDETPLMVLY